MKKIIIIGATGSLAAVEQDDLKLTLFARDVSKIKNVERANLQELINRAKLTGKLFQ